jgi:hypothetical protein
VTNFIHLFLSNSGRAPLAIADRLTQAVSALSSRRRARNRKRRGQAPPLLLSNHLRRDIGLPPVDAYGRPI